MNHIHNKSILQSVKSKQQAYEKGGNNYG